MNQSNLAWDLLNQSTGTYRGQGLNHEKQSFEGSFTLTCKLPGKLLSLESSAKGASGETYHQEFSWIGRDLAGELMLYVTSNNHPGIAPHSFHRIEEANGEKKVIFRFGDIENRHSFREEITISVFVDGAIAHHYAWGLPGGEFAPRSGSKMAKV